MKGIFKILGLLFGLFLILILAVSSNSKWFNYFIDFAPNPYRYGDVFYYSSLPKYKSKLNRGKFCLYKQRANNNINLTVIGDSYFRDFDSCSFNVQNYNFIHWDNVPDTINYLNKNDINILIIETTERYSLWRLVNSNLIVEGKKHTNIDSVKVDLNSEDKLQYIVTNYEPFISLKSLKAQIYLNLFDKVDGRVSKPDIYNNVFLKEVTDTNSIYSAYYNISDTYIDNIVESLNLSDKKLKSIGFDYIYLSIVPNSVGLNKYYKKNYNYVANRIMQDKKLQMQTINTYKLFNNSDLCAYYYNDSHWNRTGQILWLTYVNEILNKKGKN